MVLEQPKPPQCPGGDFSITTLSPEERSGVFLLPPCVNIHRHQILQDLKLSEVPQEFLQAFQPTQLQEPFPSLPEGVGALQPRAVPAGTLGQQGTDLQCRLLLWLKTQNWGAELGLPGD